MVKESTFQDSIVFSMKRYKFIKEYGEFSLIDLKEIWHVGNDRLIMIIATIGNHFPIYQGDHEDGNIIGAL